MLCSASGASSLCMPMDPTDEGLGGQLQSFPSPLTGLFQ